MPKRVRVNTLTQKTETCCCIHSLGASFYDETKMNFPIRSAGKLTNAIVLAIGFVDTVQYSLLPASQRFRSSPVFSVRSFQRPDIYPRLKYTLSYLVYFRRWP